MAATLSLSVSVSLDQQHLHHLHQFSKPYQTFSFRRPFSVHRHPFSFRHERYPFKFSSTPFHSPSTTSTSSYTDDSLSTGRFLSNEEFENLKFLENFKYFHELESGFLWIRVMRAEEMDETVALLAESFAEAMLWPSAYVSLLRFLVKQYLIERRALLPYTATLIGIYRAKSEEEKDDDEEQLAGTVEVSFDKRGSNASPPTPIPPKNSPYVFNMTVGMPLRRRGIGWHLLRASEELISQMSPSREVYLHCRMIDTAPFNMYTKAGYNVVQTDSILILLSLQRRKHLMCKKLPLLTSSSDLNFSASSVEETINS